tara:strand:- start:488 stop:607 length:120 start_codon:yes stop_codon:yes gene_type:complete
MEKVTYNNEDDLLETTEKGVLIKQALDKINEIIDWINSQ